MGSATNMKKNYLCLQVTLTNLLEHFNGTSEGSMPDLLSSLEGEFLIYRKINLYRLL